MGLISWFRGSKGSPSSTPTNQKTDPKPQPATEKPEVSGMNGAVEVSRPAISSDITVFEFGSVAASSDKVTLAGYCPVSEELEPCRWEILPASDSDAPQFRVVF